MKSSPKFFDNHKLLSWEDTAFIAFCIGGIILIAKYGRCFQ